MFFLSLIAIARGDLGKWRTRYIVPTATTKCNQSNYANTHHLQHSKNSKKINIC